MLPVNEWDRIEQKSISSCIPVKGMIELTYACNFNCVYCYLGAKRKRKEFLNRSQCSTLFQNLREAGTLVLTFTGGEIFLNSDLFDILRDARSQRFAVRIFTNGSCIGTSEAHELKTISPLSVDVSLYGASSDTYEAVTGDGRHFDMTVQGLQNLRKAEIPTVLKIVANRLNIDELPRMKQLAEDMGMDTAISPLLTPDDCGDARPCDFMLDEQALGSYFRIYGKKPAEIERRPDEIVCNSGRNAFVISPRGEVFPCIQIRKSAGNVFTSDFKTIWNDDPAPILTTIRSLRFRDFRECSSCSFASSCFFCPGLALLESGSLTGKNLTACRFTRIRRGHC